MLGTAGAERITQLAEHIIARDAAAALAALDQAIAQGVDVGQLLDQLLGYFRDLMACAVGSSANALLHVTATQQPAVQHAAQRLGLETILAALQILDQTISRLKYLTHPRTVAELAIVRICRLEDLESLPKVISQLRDGVPATNAPAPPSVATAAAKKKFDNSAGSVATHVAGGEAGKFEISPTKFAEHRHTNGHAATECSENVQVDKYPANLAHTLSESRNWTEADAISAWHQAADQLGGLGGDMARQASGAAIRAPAQLVVTFPLKYNSCRVFCERPELTKRLAELISQSLGEPIQLSFQTDSEQTAETDIARPVSHRQKMQEVCNRPYVRKAMELFDATAQRFEEAEQIKG